ncbi:MAG: O-antigen ligase family protein [Bacilli bacterium]
MKTINFILIISFITVTFILEFSFGPLINTIKGISLKNIFMYMMIISFVCQIIIGNNKKSNKNINYLVILYFIFYIIILIYKDINMNYGFNVYSLIMHFKSYMDPLIVFILIYNLELSYKDIKKIVLYFTIVFFALNIISIISASGFIDIGNVNYDEKYGRIDGVLHEENVYAAFIAMFLPLIGGYILHEKQQAVKIFMVINFILALVMLMLAGSRGGFVASILGLFYFLSVNAKQKGFRSISSFVLSFSILSAVVLLIFVALPDKSRSGLKSNIITRYEGHDIDSYSSGRLSLWVNCINRYSENPLFGANKSFVDIVGSNTHNGYLEILFYQGLVGLILYLSVIFSQFFLINRYYSTYNHFIYSSISSSFFVCLISSIFINMYVIHYFLFTLSALALQLGSVESDNL